MKIDNSNLIFRLKVEDAPVAPVSIIQWQENYALRRTCAPQEIFDTSR